MLWRVNSIQVKLEAAEEQKKSKAKTVSFNRSTTREQMLIVARHAIDVNMPELSKKQRTQEILDGLNCEDTVASDFMQHKTAGLTRPPPNFYTLKRRDWDPEVHYYQLLDREGASFALSYLVFLKWFQVFQWCVLKRAYDLRICRKTQMHVGLISDVFEIHMHVAGF